MCDECDGKFYNETIDKKNQAAILESRKWRMNWPAVIMMTIFHTGSVYGIYLLFSKAKWQTWVFAYVLYLMSIVGVTAGAHRLWSHKAFKARLSLQIILAIFYSLSYEVTIYKWVVYHRLHHKYCETDADPYNSTRGFFFSHIGWVILKEHPDVIAKMKDVDLSDVKADKVVRFQQKYFLLLVFLFCYLIPTYVPELWGEEKWTAFIIAGILRHTLSLHSIFSINSAAHKWGTKPYDKDIYPTESKIVSMLSCGEGFHNFHHTFPWDYKAAELGGYTFNLSRLFIDLMATIGWAYDLRVVSPEMIKMRVRRTGDGTHQLSQENYRDISLALEQIQKCKEKVTID